MNRPAPARTLAALAVLIPAWGLAAASVALAWIFQLPAAPVAGTFLSPAPPEAQARFDDIGVTVAVVYAPLAAVLLLRRPQPVAILLGVHAVGSGLAAFGVQYGLLSLAHPSLPGAGLLAYAGGWAFVPGTFLTAIVPVLLLPRRRSVLRRVLVRVVVAAAAVATVSSLTQQGDGPLENPLAPPWPEYQSLLPGAYAVAAALTLCSSLVVAGILARQAMRAQRDERSPLLWLFVGHVFLTASYVVTVLPASLQLAAPIWVFGTIAPIVGQIFYPSAVLVMGLQHRLRGIDVAVSAVLTTSILAVLAAGGYLLIVTTLETLAPPTPIAVFTTAAVIAIGLLPARRLIHRRVDRLVYGESGAPERLVRTLGAEVGEIATGADGLRALASALRRTLRLGSVRISTTAEPGAPSAGDDAVGVLVGTPEGVPSLFTLRPGGQSGAMTVLAVTGPDPELPVGRRAREAIADLVPVIGVVVRLAIASTALDEARGRAAEARHAERRALRRELHDGLGPALAGAGFSLAAASNFLARGDRAAAEDAARGVDALLDAQTVTLTGLARGGTAEVHDLAAELHSLVMSFAGAASTVHLSVAGTLVLDPGRSGILLRIAAEALLNAVRHAEAASVEVTLGGQEGVILRVRDDGRGMREASGAGVGLASMREWAQEAGLSIAWEQPTDGGTLVLVRAADPRLR
ncbi:MULTISPECIES: sensor histidine kinase [unclassified Microbacterium]|uniref:sensor histidine kinase n=1 Tax=unclassified Microbacterium TaxID=2609290 RepID=UPI00109C7BA7|nr:MULTISPECIES: ATP-binding protein [unclassified Microbacterium]